MDLRANTAVDILIGPYSDDTDGNTPEEALTIVRADVKLSKNGQTLTQKTEASNSVHDADGYYNCPLDTTDLNTEGNLVVESHKTGALPVRHEYNVLSEAAWDSLYAPKDTGFMDVNLAHIAGTALTEGGAGRLAAAFIKLFDVATPELSSADWTAAKAAFINAAISSRAPSGEYNTQLDATISSRSSHTAAAAASAVWSFVIEGTKTGLNFMRIMFAILRGKSDGGDTNTLVYYGDNGTKVRHTETVDNDGNRTAVSSDGT